MLSHQGIWSAIDRLAARNGLSTSGLAKLAGLDPTTFNKSKRIARDGRERWPSTESLAKILEATGDSLDCLLSLMEPANADRLPQVRTVPLLGMSEAGHGGFFDDGGRPTGHGWDEVAFPNMPENAVYALEVSGDAMLPLYRDGDVVIVSPSDTVRRGDRVVVRTRSGEVLARILHRKTLRTVELHALDADAAPQVLGLNEVAWIARIVWASQ